MSPNHQHTDQNSARSLPAQDHSAARDRQAAGVVSSPPPSKPSHKRDVDAQPTGTPNSDRHATETVHGWEHEQG